MLKIMIVDNEAAIRKGLVHCIRWEALGCTVAAQAVDGVDALEQLPAVQPDIIISDIRMPGMDGLALAHRVSVDYPRSKVIILTGFPDFEYAQRAIEYRVVDFVLKPTSVESLTQAIEKAKARIAEEQSSEELARRLAHKSAQNLQLERGILLQDLMQRVALSYLYVLSRTAQLGLNLTSYHVLRLDLAPLGNAPEDQTDLLPHLHQSQAILTEVLAECAVYFVPRGDQTCYVVVCTADTALLDARCRETVDILGSLPRFTLFIGISRHWEDPMHLADAAEQAKQAAQLASHSLESPVVRFDQMPSIPPQAMQRVFDDLRLLKSAIENQNPIGSQEILLRLFAFARESKLPVETVRNICVSIHQFCTSLLFQPNPDGYLSENGLPTLKRLLGDDSLDHMEQSMQVLVAQIFAHTGGDAADAAGIIRAVKAYVAQHCAEDLSLELLSGLVYISPSYLSRLFKRETGENLSSYVQNIRIEQAKTLLLTTSLKTYEVAGRVGIPDPVYFSRIFKKVTGIKPKDFRKESEGRTP